MDSLDNIKVIKKLPRNNVTLQPGMWGYKTKESKDKNKLHSDQYDPENKRIEKWTSYEETKLEGLFTTLNNNEKRAIKNLVDATHRKAIEAIYSFRTSMSYL